MTRATAARINRAIDAAARASQVIPQAVAFLAWVVILVLLTQAVPFIPWLAE